jgi:signal transduction histidine kinase
LFQPDLPLVFADIGMMEQVLMNLVVNARDAMPKGGRLTIAPSSKFISVNKFPNSDGITEGEYVVMSIKDTGQGIKPEYLSKIFDPFFTTKGIGKGTWLGLATVHNIIYQHNG